MSLAVVRCPACLGPSRVEPDAVGQMVACPRCQVPFVAAEEVPVVQPRARSRNTAALPRPASAVPVASPRRPRLQLPAPPVEPEPAPPADAPLIPDPEHDPHSPPPAGLPVSVLVGLALLPFGIPLLWWATPVLTGQVAALSLAVPISLAFSASTLCLGVVYTIDWTGTTRVKGVLMLVGLAYMSAAGLYFLKKDLVDRVHQFGGDSDPWVTVSSMEGNCRLRMPQPVSHPKDHQPLPGVEMIDVRSATHLQTRNGPIYRYCFAVSKQDAKLSKADGRWFNRIGEKLKGENGEPTSQHELHHRDKPDAPGRQWTFTREGEKAVRIVQVFVIKGRVYYLSAEGPHLTPTDENFAEPFFGKFFVN